LVIVPPFPLSRSVLCSGWEPAPILTLLEEEHTVGVVLLRLGRFSVAIYRGSRLLSSKTDARYVKGRHHAGGTSQKRFERIREGQIRRLYGKTCEAVQGQFGASATPLDYILLGGDKFTLDGFLKACPYLQSWRSVTLGRRLNVRDPKRDTLEQVARMLWESMVWRVEW
jgi:peptide subunit release factor 1 (eRF1)